MIRSVGTAERRRQLRKEAVWPVILRDESGQEIARGKTINISNTGIFAMFDGQLSVGPGEEYQIEFAVPTTDPGGGARPLDTRTNRYTCRIVRSSRLGSMVGMGIEFLRPF